MIDIEAGLLALMAGGEREVELSVNSDGNIRVMAIPVMARFAKKSGLGSTLEHAMIACAERVNEYGVNVELPLALDPTLCEHCGLPLEPHPECVEAEQERDYDIQQAERNVQ